MEKNCSPGLVLLVLVLGLSHLSCSDFGEPLANVPIDGKVKVKVFEGHLGYMEGKDPTILLEMVTEKAYPCYNYSIIAGVSTVPGTIMVRLAGIYEPEMCLTAFGPATYRSTLPVSPGSYELLLLYNGLTDRYTMDITDAALRLTPVRSAFTATPSPLNWRIPERSFAYVCGTTVETAWMYEGFRDSLLRIPEVREFSFPDSGEVPYPAASSGYWNDEPARYFLYNTEADFDSAGAMLKRYKDRVIGDKQGIGIYLMNWKDIRFMSWMM